MKRILLFTAVAIVVVHNADAFASGLAMAETWTWKRDGARILNSFVVLGAVVWLVIKFGGPMLKNRAKAIAEKFETLEQNRARAEASFKEYESKVKALKDETVKIREEAKAEGELIKTRIVEQAKESAELIIGKASERITLETEQAKERLMVEARIAAVDMAEEIIKKNIGPKDQETILSGYIDDLGSQRN